MTNGTEQSGWDGPMELDWGYELDTLRDLLARFAPADSMALRNDLRKPSTTTLNHDRTVIAIEIKPPNLSWQYAKIQDQGGKPYDIIKAKGPGHVMRAFIDGKIRYFTKRAAIPATNYVDKAVAAWSATKSFVTIKWRTGRAGQGLRTPREAMKESQ